MQSANGEAIVWLRLDDGEIPVFHLVDLMETHSKITRQRYPKPGKRDMISVLRLQVKTKACVFPTGIVKKSS